MSEIPGVSFAYLGGLGNGGSRGDNQDRHFVARLSGLPDQIQAIAIRQAKINQNQIMNPAENGFRRLGGTSKCIDLPTNGMNAFSQKFDETSIIFDKQQAHVQYPV